MSVPIIYIESEEEEEKYLSEYKFSIHNKILEKGTMKINLFVLLYKT